MIPTLHQQALDLRDAAEALAGILAEADPKSMLVIDQLMALAELDRIRARLAKLSDRLANQAAPTVRPPRRKRARAKG